MGMECTAIASPFASAPWFCDPKTLLRLSVSLFDRAPALGTFILVLHGPGPLQSWERGEGDDRGRRGGRGLIHSLRSRALFTYFARFFSKSRSFTTLVSLCRIFRLTKGIKQVDKISASMTLNVDLNSATSASVRVHADRMIEHSDMRLSRFLPDAQPRPTILSRVNSKVGKVGTDPLATQIC